jgi:hypothetical protein
LDRKMTLPLFNDQTDDTPIEVGEVAFVGVNRVVKPSMLPEGMLARARNIRIDASGAVATRPGSRMVNPLTLGTYNAAATLRTQGLGYYDVGGYERIMVARQGKVHTLDSAASTSTAATLSATVDGNASVSFEQLINRIYWSDGITLQNGYTTAGVWTIATVATMQSGASAVPLPGFKILRAHRFRLLGVPDASDYIYPSSIGQAFTAGVGGDWNELKAIRVGDGDGDPITALISGQSTQLTVLKQASCWSVDTTGTDSATWSISKITGLTGCVAGRTAIATGQDIIFLSRYGVVSLGGLERTDSISKAATLSASIQPIIDRINWSAITTAHAVQYRDHYLLFVPLDNATQPNTCIPLNLTTRQWLDEWTWALTDQVAYYNDTDNIVDEAAANITDENGDPLFDYTPIVASMTGFSAACLSRFDGREETIIGDSIGRIFRLDESLTVDQDNATTTQDIEAFVTTRAWDFGFPRNRKLPFNLELEFMDSTSIDLTAIIVRNGRSSYPATTMARSEPVQEAFVGRNSPVIPMRIPFTLETTTQSRNAWNLREFAPMREGQVTVLSKNGQIGLRGIRLSALVDTIELTGTTQV